MEMTRERLEGYRSCREEIQELQYKLDHLGEGDSLIGNDVIMDYRDGFPRPQSVVGYDYDKYERLRKAYESRIAKLQTECAEVELWIEAIPDSLTRRIFRMCFVDGVPLQKIGQKVHLDKSTVSRKINNYLKVATHATNATL